MTAEGSRRAASTIARPSVAVGRRGRWQWDRTGCGLRLPRVDEFDSGVGEVLGVAGGDGEVA